MEREYDGRADNGPVRIPPSTSLISEPPSKGGRRRRPLRAGAPPRTVQGELEAAAGVPLRTASSGRRRGTDRLRRPRERAGRSFRRTRRRHRSAGRAPARPELRPPGRPPGPRGVRLAPDGFHARFSAAGKDLRLPSPPGRVSPSSRRSRGGPGEGAARRRQDARGGATPRRPAGLRAFLRHGIRPRFDGPDPRAARRRRGGEPGCRHGRG